MFTFQLLGVGLAQAGPYTMLQPAHTMPRNETEMGSSLAYSAAPSALDRGQTVLSAWARYGITDRFEVSGGAFVPWIYDLGLHGNVRYHLLGTPGSDGPHLSSGVGVGTLTGNLSALSFTVPVTAGVSTDNAHFFGGPEVSAIPLGDAGTLLTWQVEAGAAVEASGIPIYFSALYGRALGADILGLRLGFGYNLKI